MGSYWIVALWVVGCVLVGVVAGYYIGTRKENWRAKDAQKATLKTLVEILKAVEQLSSDVDTHSSEIREVGRHVGDLKATGELEEVQKIILHHIGALLKSNQKLENELVCAHYQMAKQAEELDRTRHEARTDALCNVANRKAFDESLHWLLATWQRDRQSFALILLDLDRFKWINDTHGHQTGDRVLSQMGALLKQGVREGDIVTRYGGDEFALLLPNADLAEGMRVAARLRALIYRTTFAMSSHSEQGVVSVSLGVTAVRDGDTFESVLSRADIALYKSKETGRNRVYSCNGEDLRVELVEAVDLP